MFIFPAAVDADKLVLVYLNVNNITWPLPDTWPYCMSGKIQVFMAVAIRVQSDTNLPTFQNPSFLSF